MDIVGIDASKNVVDIANSKGIETHCSFFDDNIVQKIIQQKNRKPLVITATNLFAHIQNYDTFMKSLLSLLDEEGIFVFSIARLKSSCLRNVKRNSKSTFTFPLTYECFQHKITVRLHSTPSRT